MAGNRAFNPFLVLQPRPQSEAIESWWLQTPTQADFYARARYEAPRMARSPEAKSIQPRCLDDLKTL